MNDTTTQRNVYDIVTDRIVGQLERGTVPWHQPWDDTTRPKNLATNKPYRGINLWLLGNLGYSSNFFLTFKQARNIGARVKKGEKAHPVVFWIRIEREDPETKEKRMVSVLRYSLVFNIDQCEGVPEGKIPMQHTVKIDTIEACETVLWAMPKRPEIYHEKDGAYYDPVFDTVNMPKKDTFVSTEEYYCTLFHELVHSTGHHSRLSRKGLVGRTVFGSHEYTVEELVAEMGACYLCSLTGIEKATFPNSAAYISGWLARLRSDRRFVVLASVLAQKAVDYILGYPPKNTKNEKEAMEKTKREP